MDKNAASDWKELDGKKERLVRRFGTASTVLRIGACLAVLLAVLTFAALRRLSVADVDSYLSGARCNAAERTPAIYPDYVGCAVPPNIAPMNFEIREEGALFLTRFSVENGFSFVEKGKTADVSIGRWRKLLAEAVGKRVKVEVFVKGTNGEWSVFSPFYMNVAETPIDGWLHYRLIEPGYEYFSQITLAERNLETFDERFWFEAKSTNNRTCVNCHTFQNRRTENFLFHMRRICPGSVLCRDGFVTKIDPNVPSDVLGAAYAAWNPTKPLVAFSTNATFQMFHSLSPDRIEVLDAASDLILFDAERSKSKPLCTTPELFETFPSWSQDGATLYYCVAESPYSDAPSTEKAPAPIATASVLESANSDEIDRRKLEAPDVYANFRYNLARRAFDPTTQTVGEQETLVDAASFGKSISHPRASPDASTLVYTLSKYGTFPIWRRDADLWSLDLATGETRPLDELNSDESESWHEWDSSGRWLIFSSRRDDGAFTRVYIAYYSENGNWSKPFLLPQRNPRENFERMKSYNLPEPTVEPIRISPRKLAQAARRPC